ncbi:MAG: hypothetical protein MJA29_11140 [Candidatus Omnitrophica bacterium]|nr:hypothetical protein [Candidatus Omnitrophota bacterium]
MTNAFRGVSYSMKILHPSVSQWKREEPRKITWRTHARENIVPAGIALVFFVFVCDTLATYGVPF